MKKALLIFISSVAGGLIVKAAETERGKRCINWAKNKAQAQINNLVNKVDEITTETTSEKEAVTE
jgi:hypothetical protein